MSALPRQKIEPQIKAETPPNFSELMAAINQSRRMLAWEENWDGEGSPGFVESTLARAADFLLSHADALWQQYEKAVEAPDIGPGPDGSIDIDWRVMGRELLLNIPADVTKPATFYGDTHAGTYLKGSISLSETNLWLMIWLTA